MIGYFRFGIEVERLVHHPVQVRHPIVGLHGERFGKLEAHLLEGAQVRRLELRHEVAERVVEQGFRRRVDARRVGDEIAIRLRDDRRLRRIPRREQLQARAVESDAVEVRVVRVFALFAARRREVHDARLLVDALERGRDELAFSDPVLERAGRGVIQIEVTPAVALRPEDQLRPVAGQAEGLRLDVGVQPLLDERLDLAGGGVGNADVEAMHVAAEAREVELVRPVVQPFLRARRRLRSAGPTAAPAPRACHRALRLGGNADGLILKALRLDLDAVFGLHVEDEDLRLRRVLLAGHGVAVGLERGTRIGERVDDPEVLDLAHVAADERELARVARPLALAPPPRGRSSRRRPRAAPAAARLPVVVVAAAVAAAGRPGCHARRCGSSSRRNPRRRS